MARAPTVKKAATKLPAAISIPKPRFERFSVWAVGDTPVICHAWSEKGRRDLLDKQLGVVKPRGREKRDPEADCLLSVSWRWERSGDDCSSAAR